MTFSESWDSIGAFSKVYHCLNQATRESADLWRALKFEGLSKHAPPSLPTHPASSRGNVIEDLLMPLNEYEGLWEHPDWKTYKPNADTNELGRKFDDISAIDSFIVQIQFVEVVNRRRELFTGNGFFLKLPDVEGRHLIMTAASHLFVNGRRTTNVKLYYQAQNNQGEPTIVECEIDNSFTSTQVQIFNMYPASGVPYPGYAAISIPRASGENSRGFGFSLKLGLRTSFGEFIYTSSFDNVVPTPLLPDTFVISNATRSNIQDADSLSYLASLEESSSGGPLWLEYKGHPTIIGIHKTDGDACFGTLLTTDMFKELFNWLNAGLFRKNVQLQIHPDDLLSANYHTGNRGVFLSFLSNAGFARVRLDSGSHFDWMLAEVGENEQYYVLSLAGQKEWVRFDAEAAMYQSVLLGKELEAPGLFLQNVAEKGKPWVVLTATTFLAQSTGKHLKVRLRMEGARLKAYDSTRESSEVSLVRVDAFESSLPFFRVIMTEAPDTSQDGSSMAMPDQCLDGSDGV